VGWVAGAAGVVGLGVGAVFGIVAIGNKNSAHCDANNACDPGSTDAIKSAAFVSDVGWVGGGVLLAAGAALVLLSPSEKHERVAKVEVTPTAASNGAGLAVRGTW
jgi:hypothetical protein